MTETTNGFRAEYFFLSNFYQSPIRLQLDDGFYTFPTGEHAFQAMKVGAALKPSDNEVLLYQLEKTPTPAKAKYWGRSIRIDIKRWDAMAEDAMRRTVVEKFLQNKDLAAKLIATGDTTLVEYNNWNDRLWGVDANSGQGQNKLGVLLMELRETLGR